jgi:hypothetical protein
MNTRFLTKKPVDKKCGRWKRKRGSLHLEASGFGWDIMRDLEDGRSLLLQRCIVDDELVHIIRAEERQVRLLVAPQRAHCEAVDVRKDAFRSSASDMVE